MDPIQQFALEKAGMTNADREKAREHRASCTCKVCEQFNVYIRVRELVESWERWRKHNT